jgi:hypothetical protein
MARSSNCRPRCVTMRGVAHILECALFGGCGIRTGHPVADGVPRCRAKYPKRLLQHAVPFGIPHPVRPA